jgi:uncharacterized protein
MLVEFSVGNFWSFKEIQTLQMRAAKISSKYPKLDEDNVVVVDEQLSLLKSKAVFGANGSGKSNLVRAMESMFYIFFNGVKDMDALKRSIIPFSLDKETINEPSFFQIEFIFENILYRYGFEADIKSVHSEWLFGKKLNANKPTREKKYFTREGINIDINESIFKEAKNFMKTSSNIPYFRNNVLFLTVLALWSVPLPLKINNFLQHQILLIPNNFNEELSESLALNEIIDPIFRTKVINLLKGVDPTIREIQRIEYDLESLGNQYPESQNFITELKKNGQKITDLVVIRSIEGQNEGASFRMSLQEAEGTKKIFSLSPYIFYALEHGSTLIIDEFDAKMHPQLTRKIVELFHSPSTNPQNGQLVFITHDSNLLDPQLLRRDQISFAQKDKNGATELYSLVEFKGVRNDASFEKDYLQGKYRAVPTNLNQLEALFENN